VAVGFFNARQFQEGNREVTPVEVRGSGADGVAAHLPMGRWVEAKQHGNGGHRPVVEAACLVARGRRS
jgi:hypothetical protein